MLPIGRLLIPRGPSPAGPKIERPSQLEPNAPCPDLLGCLCGRQTEDIDAIALKLLGIPLVLLLPPEEFFFLGPAVDVLQPLGHDRVFAQIQKALGKFRAASRNQELFSTLNRC